MAISLYFGLPGCGKTTWLSKLALDAIKSGKYEFVYSNVSLAIPGITIIDNDVIGKYELENCLLLIDEATLFADSRDFKNFSKGRLEYFLEHRHRCADIILFTQQWDGVDRKIRVITDRVYYVYKGFLLGRWFSKCWKVPYGVLFPDPKKSGEKLGEIVQGYSKPPLLARIFCQRIYRPKYYKYFDSWELVKLPPLPDEYKSEKLNCCNGPIFRSWLRSSSSILKDTRKGRRKYYAKRRKILWCSRLERFNSLLRSAETGRFSKKRTAGAERT